MKWWQWSMVALTLGVLLTAQVAVKHQLLQEDIGYVNCHQYGVASTHATVITCLAALAGTSRTAFLSPGTWTFSSNVIIPSNVRLFIPNGTTIVLTGTAALTVQGPLRIESGGSLCPGSTASVTATGPLEFGVYQVFCTGAGAVSFNGTASLPAVLPQWFGAHFVAGGAAGVTTDDCAVGIRAALSALPAEGGTLQLGAGACLIKTTVVIAKRVIIAGYGFSSLVDKAPTLLVKASTLNGPVFQVGDHLGLNHVASNTILRDFTIVGQAGNGGDGITILDHQVSVSGVMVASMGNDGFRVGSDVTPACDCNIWSMQNVVSSFNGRDGIRIAHVGGIAPDSNAGTLAHANIGPNGNAGLYLTNAWLNHIYGIVVHDSVSYGIIFGQSAFYNHIDGIDASENNCTGGCGGRPGDILFQAGVTPPRLNSVLGATLFSLRTIDDTPLGTSNTYTTFRADEAGTILHGLLSIGFANATTTVGLPPRTYFSVRSAQAILTFPPIAPNNRAMQSMTMPDFVAPLKACTCEMGDFGSGITWNSWAIEGGCTVSVSNHLTTTVTLPAIPWRCIGFQFPTAP